MKLAGFLTERKGTPFMEVMRSLHADCQPFLKEWAKPQKGSVMVSFMYRGMQERLHLIKKNVRTNRKPTDTHETISADFDKAFQKKFGYPARSNSIFITGKYAEALQYGEAFIIFPLGKYKYLWSEWIRDLFGELNSINGSAGNTSTLGDYDNPIIQTKVANKTAYHTMKIVFDKEWKKKWATKGHWEIMFMDTGKVVIVPDSYKTKPLDWLKKEWPDEHAKDNFQYEWKDEMPLGDWIEKDWDRFSKDYYERVTMIARQEYDDMIDKMLSSYNNNDLIKGIDSHNEMMVTCKQYWALDARNGVSKTLTRWFSSFGDRMPSDKEIEKWWYHHGEQWPGELGL